MNQIYFLLRKLILPIEDIEKAIPKKGTIVDLGCGQGLIATYLAQTKTRDLIGIDNNLLRLPKAKQKNLKFKNGDLTKLDLPKIDGAVISDVLHHLAPNDQKELMTKVFTNLKTEGVFVIKEIDSEETIRSMLSRIWDFVLYPKDKISYNSAKDLKHFLKSTGFKNIKNTRPCRLFPGSTTLFVCTK